MAAGVVLPCQLVRLYKHSAATISVRVPLWRYNHATYAPGSNAHSLATTQFSRGLMLEELGRRIRRGYGAGT